MKSTSRKIIAFVLSVVMMFSVSAVAFAEPIEDTDKIIFAYRDDSEIKDFYVITGVEELDISGDVLTVPAVYREKNFVLDPDAEETYSLYPISSIGEFAFTSTWSLAYSELSSVKKIIIEDGIKSIDRGAFMKLPALEEVVFEGDIIIGSEAFSQCPALKSVTFKGDAVLGEYAFFGCSELDSFDANFEATYNAPKTAFEGTAWYETSDFPYIILGTTLLEYRGNDEELVLPQRVTKIGTEAFKGNHSLRKITFNSFIDTLGDRAFETCTALEEVKFSPNGKITSIGSDIFKDTPYFNNFDGEFFTIENTLVKYKGEGVPFVAIPNTVTTIAPRAFDGCYKTYEKDGKTFVISAILVPTSVTELGEDCFVLGAETDGTNYAPKIYAYDDTSAMTALKEAGYDVVSMEYRKGDLDKNGKINAEDARIALRLSVGLEESTIFNTYAADLDGNRRVTAADARTLLRIAVGLEKYTIEGLHAIPTTKVEILNMYKTAITKAAADRLGYNKIISNTVSAGNVSLTNRKQIESLVSTGAKNVTLEFLRGNRTAEATLPYTTLENTNLIKYARCDATDGKYIITMTLYDVLDCDITAATPDYAGGTPYIASIIPVVSGREFFNAFSAQKWFKFDKGFFKDNYINKYSLRYTNPTVTAVIDIETGKPEEIKLSVGYDFVLNGRSNCLSFNKNLCDVDTLVQRSDVVTYTNFN